MSESSSSSSSSSLTHLRPEVLALHERLRAFVEDECIPCEREYEDHLKHRHGADRWTADAVPPCLDRLKARSKQLGLWNLFISPRLVARVPDRSLAPSIPLTHREYGVFCETMGRCPSIAPEACNTSAPDTGNMEVLLEFGTPAQRHKYLLPLLRGEIRSTFLMTEPQVASSDPTNLETQLVRRRRRSGGTTADGGEGEYEYELTGRKWWSTGAMDPRCRVALVVAKTNPANDTNSSSSSSSSSDPNSRRRHGSHTVVLVELPNPSVVMERPLTAFGYDDAPSGHAEVSLNGVRLTSADLVLGEGSGFAVSQARLGPGRIHHCMRSIGMAARCYELMLQRSVERKTFGKYLWEHGGCQEMIAESFSDLEAARLLTLSCAAAMDDVGAKRARDKIASIKVAVPELTYKVVDRAVQVFGGAGVSDDFLLARALVGLRTLRIADGPDAVHKRTVARLEIKKLKQQRSRL